MMKKLFTIYLIQTAHTDIGYTHPQEQIALMYLDIYDRVLDLCRRSETSPEPHRFKWVCEAAWQIHNYVAARPEREAELIRYMRTGQIEIVANYLHFSDLIDPEAYERSLLWAVEYCQQHNLPLKCLLHCDINGWPWAVADIAAKYNLPYFCSQVHVDSATDPLGRRGSVHYQWRMTNPDIVADAPVRIPQAFWWQGAGGGQVLHWLGEHYGFGNVLGLSGNYEFGTDKTRYYYEADQTSVDELFQIACREVPQYVEHLRQQGFPYDRILIGTGGVFADNAPPDDRWCRIIQRWNAEHEDIQIRTTTLSEWFEALEAQDDFREWPVYQTAWPDHWSHGLGSAATQMAQARRTQRRRQSVAAFVEMAKSKQAADYLDIALEQEILALEHTFSAWSTTRRPNWRLNDFQQAAKELTFHRAELYLDEATTAALRTFLPRQKSLPYLHFLNVRSQNELFSVQFNGGDWRPNPNSQVLKASDGKLFKFQLDSNDPDEFVAMLPVSHGEPVSFELVESGETAVNPPSSPLQINTLETAHWSLTIDPEAGGLASLREKGNGREWVDASQPHAFGQLVHQSVIHPLGREAVSNTNIWHSLDIGSEQLKARWTDEPIYDMTALQTETAPALHAGPIFDALKYDGFSEALGSVHVAWRAYHDLPIVELVLDWNKKWHNKPEAAYVTFPFATKDADLQLEASGGFFRPGSFDAGGQLPGTCTTYYTVQRAAQITTPKQASLLWMPLDAPLVMTNSLEFNRWEREPWQWNGFLASMPVNHYWHTNFAISQRGHIRLRYRFMAKQPDESIESALGEVMPLDALGWR